MNIEIVRLDDNGRGIGYIDGKIVFVPKTLPGDVCIVDLTLEKKKYSEAKLVSIEKPSSLRIDTPCAHFDKCGGCQYLNMKYEDGIKFKFDNFANNLKRNDIPNYIENITNSNYVNYRNKASFKIKNKVLGYYEEKSNNIVEINYCYIVSNNINKYIEEIKKLNITSGDVVIRSNYKNDILISINTKDKIDINLMNLEDVVGVILNDNCIYGVNYLMEQISGLDFEITYNSFFQVNSNLIPDIFRIMNTFITPDDVVLDLYCGVGLLGLNASKKAKKVYGVEIAKHSVISARNNALLNNIENTEFIHSDLNKKLPIKEKINTLIVDPPRSGLSSLVLDYVSNEKPEKIIYMSCSQSSLIRDLKVLKKNYEVKIIYAIDIFSFTHHVESICILKRK